MRAAFPWEAAYPPGLAWDTPIVPSTLGALLDGAAARFADRPAIRYRDAAMDYATLHAMTRRVAGALLALPAAREGVALLVGNTLYHPPVVFGAAMAGLRVVMLSPLDAPRTIAHKLADSGARVLVTVAHEGLLKLAAGMQAQGLVSHLVVGDDARWGAGPAAAPQPDGAIALEEWLDGPDPAALPSVTPDDVMLLQYTGGTTGPPKGAILTHGNLTAAVAQATIWNGGRGPDVKRERARVIGVLPLFHIFAFTGVLLLHLSLGNEVLLHARFDPEAVLHDIEVGRAASFPAVPTMWIALANLPDIDRRDLSSLRQAFSGGAPLPVEVAARFERLTGQRIQSGWGMTETSPGGTTTPTHPDAPWRPGSIGLPIPGVELRVVALDDPRRVLAAGETGEIAIRGPNVFGGYWKTDSRASFVDGFFLTGDVGRMDPDGFFFLTDRKKDMIISGGFNVYPRAIEEAIYEHPDVAECIVIGIPDAYRGQAAKAFVALRDGAPTLTLAALQAFLAERVGRHEMPAALELRDSLPKTPVGKLTKLPLIEELAVRVPQTA